MIIIALQINNKETMDPIEKNTFPFQTIIINLDRKPERYFYITTQLNKLGIKEYELLSATDGFKAKDDEMLKVGVSQKLIKEEV